jgi:hypothetical protein
MLDALRKLFIAINAKAQSHAFGQDVRRLVLLALRSKGRLGSQIADLQAIADFISLETASWIPPEAIGQGRGGHFDTCDLRHWLAIAALAGVPAVPARVILELSEDEMSVASGGFEIPESYRIRLAAAAAKYLPEPSDEVVTAPATDPGSVAEKLAAALDDVPEGHMVRHVRCGPSTLKTLSGVGIAGPAAPETRFGADLEVGPGWVRRGNRRAVDAADRRIVEGYAQGPDGPSVFVARPWVPAARFMHGEDPHRHGTQYAGKGFWPAEWRAYVENDRVLGVGFYYGWCGDSSPASAVAALQIRDLAQRIVDQAARQRAIPLYLDTEIARNGEAFREALEPRFSRDRIACTLDFIETAEGPLLLEGGPPFNPYIGGGHPTAFAGATDPIDGVAFRCMPGISLAEPKTWRGTHDRSGVVLNWEETERLAAEATPGPPSP